MGRFACRGSREDYPIAPLFDESSDDGLRFRFRLPTRRGRLDIAKRMLKWALILTLWAILPQFLGEWKILYWILTAPVPLGAAVLILSWILILWSRQDLVVDAREESLRISSRGLWAPGPREVPFRELRAVEFGLEDRDSETWEMRLTLTDGDPIPLARSFSREDTEHAAERLASLLRIPVSTSPEPP